MISELLGAPVKKIHCQATGLCQMVAELPGPELLVGESMFQAVEIVQAKVK